TMAAMRVAYNGHKHKENGSITDVPDTKMEA
ncbi:baseplate assembly protein, partial [Escherichia coli]